MAGCNPFLEKLLQNCLCDLLENELATCDREIPFYPFEIQTIKFVL